MAGIIQALIAFFTALISMWVIVLEMFMQALGLTNSIFPEFLLWPFAALFATLFFIPTCFLVIPGVLGVPSSWWSLIETGQEAMERNKTARYNTDSTWLATLVTIWEVLVPPIPIAVDEDAASSFKLIKSMLFRESCKYYKSPEPDHYHRHSDEVWIFINGVATTKAVADENCKMLNEMFDRPINLLYNPTDSVIVDLFECCAGKTGLLSFGETEPRHELKTALKRELVRPEIKKVVLIAHSQGTIIAGNAVADLGKLAGAWTHMLSKLEVYNFADCAHTMPQENVAHLENISNKGDFVAWLGALFPMPWLWRNTAGDGIKISGVPIVQEGAWGHMLNTHYLDGMRNKKRYAKSKLVTHYKKWQYPQ